MVPLPTQDIAEPKLPMQIAFFLFTLSVLFLCALVLQPFLSAIVGAIVLAVITQRPYNWLALRIKSRAASATVAVLLVILSIIVPAFFLAQHLGKQAIGLAITLRTDTTQQKFLAYFAQHPGLANAIDSATDGVDLQRTAQVTAAFIGGKLPGLLGHSIRFITQVVVMLFILFFLYRDKEQALAFARSLLPLGAEETDELLEKLHDTIDATALGRLTIAAIQGSLAGLGFWALSVPSYLFWALLTVLFAMIPGFGTFLVWGPVAIYLGISGHWGKALLLGIWGGIIVSTIDNLLYPIMVGTRLRQHTATILVSILGGIALFGLAGLILGPVLFATAGTLLQFWRARRFTADSPR